MRDKGFVMVALLIGMAVTAVWMATMLPAWRQQAIREKEENLVFYGNQYAKALAHYYLKNNCTLPADVDALVSGHYLRRKWKDPITGKDFLPQMIGGATASGGLGQTPANMGPRGGTGNTGQQQAPIGGNRGGAQPAAPAGPAGGVNSGRGNTPTGPGGVAPGPVQQGGSGQPQLVGLAGVTSESTATSIRLVNQTQQYNLWRFGYGEGLNMLGARQGCQNGQPLGFGTPAGQQGGARQGDGRGSPVNAPGGLSPRGGGPTVPGGLQGGGGPPPPGATSGRGRGGN
jgi:type II secretory pathway pseudopilin PulG